MLRHPNLTDGVLTKLSSLSEMNSVSLPDSRNIAPQSLNIVPANLKLCSDNESQATYGLPSTLNSAPASNSSTSSETSNTSQNNSCSFEEQFKQVRQLYEINDDPKRKDFLDDLFSFMQKRGTPINRLPIMAKSVLDLFELYNLVIDRGGLVDVINKKLWQEIIKGLHLPSSITSAAFTLRTQYMKYLYPYECERKNFSSPAALQAAIDGNRRECRRTAYGHYEALQGHIQIPQLTRQTFPNGIQPISPLSLLIPKANSSEQQSNSTDTHLKLTPSNFGQMSPSVTHDIEDRMMTYFKLIQVKKDQDKINNYRISDSHDNNDPAGSSLHQLKRVTNSPHLTAHNALNALELSRVALWQMFHNSASSPNPVDILQRSDLANTSVIDTRIANEMPTCAEMVNLSDSPSSTPIKREWEEHASPEHCDISNSELHQPSPAKRFGVMFPQPGYGSSPFYSHNIEKVNKFQSKNDVYQSKTEDLERPAANRNYGTTSTSENNGKELLYRASEARQMELASLKKPTIESNEELFPLASKPSSEHAKELRSTSELRNPNEKLGSISTKESKILTGFQFQIKQNDSSDVSGDLVVNLLLNGLQYTGVLFANTSIDGNEDNTKKDKEPNCQSENMASQATNIFHPETNKLTISDRTLQLGHEQEGFHKFDHSRIEDSSTLTDTKQDL